MKKVNFNALQNFEVPESWIENAINAKPKKKIYQLNFRYIGTAASVVLAVGITLFSLLYINRDVNPPVSPIVSTKSVASTPKQETTAATTSINEKTATRPSETTTGTVAATTSANSQARSTEASAAAQPTNASAQTTARPEQTSNATRQTESTRPGQSKPTSPTQPVQPQVTTTPEKETKTTDPVQDTTGSTEATEPTGALEKVRTGWKTIKNYSGRAGAVSDEIKVREYGTEIEKEISCDDLFTNKIDIALPREIRNVNLINVYCTITGVGKYTDGIEGTMKFGFDDTIQTLIDAGTITGGIISINLLSDASINIPCGEYEVELKCEKANYVKSIPVTLYNDDFDSVKFDFG